MRDNDSEIQVKLSPIMGIRPGVYLTALYSFILIVIIFIFLFLPGIRNPQTALVVKTEPFGAAIRVNGIFMGVSGSKILIPKGTHTIEAVMPGFESQTAVHEIPGRVFASSFFPKKYHVSFSLKTPDPALAFSLYAADFASWTFAGEPTAAWQAPLSLSEGAYRIGPQIGSSKEAKEEIQQILIAASRFTVTKNALRDVIRAKILLDNNGNAPSPISLLGSIANMTAFVSKTPGCALWLADLLPQEAASVIEESNWYLSEFTIQPFILPLLSGINNIDSERARFSRLTVSGQNFINVPAGSMVMEGKNFLNSGFSAIQTNVNNYIMSERPVSVSLFQTFLNENPQWNEHYTDYFSDEIAAGFLAVNRNNITGITWYAAEAFCKWFAARLPASMAGMEVRLITETEWEFAVLHSLINMESAGWEWCYDPYTPLLFISASDEAIQAVGSPERSLRGRALNSAETRASLPPDLSSPFVTFRIVLVPGH